MVVRTPIWTNKKNVVKIIRDNFLWIINMILNFPDLESFYDSLPDPPPDQRECDSDSDCDPYSFCRHDGFGSR